MNAWNFEHCIEISYLNQNEKQYSLFFDGIKVIWCIKYFFFKF